MQLLDCDFLPIGDKNSSPSLFNVNIMKDPANHKVNVAAEKLTT